VVGLWATGILEHVHLYITYTARMVFPTEIYGAIQDFPNSAMPFRDIRSAWLFSFLFLGQIFGVLWGSQLVRIACFVCIAALIAMTCIVIIYVFVVPNWPYPMPAYFEFAGTPLFLIAAISGYIEFLRRIFSKHAAGRLHSNRVQFTPALVPLRRTDSSAERQHLRLQIPALLAVQRRAQSPARNHHH
jgi:hypothetical protein